MCRTCFHNLSGDHFKTGLQLWSIAAGGSQAIFDVGGQDGTVTFEAVHNKAIRRNPLRNDSGLLFTGDQWPWRGFLDPFVDPKNLETTRVSEWQKIVFSSVNCSMGNQTEVSEVYIYVYIYIK